jgi:S-DNA-T family DNA segregation ATPase FtsK/SpoIIIE
MELKLKWENLKTSLEMHNKISRLEKAWIKILSNAGVFNKEKDTYSLEEIEPVKCGYNAKVFIPYGLTFEGLEKAAILIQDSLPCILMLSKNKNENFAYARIIQTPAKVGKFFPPKVKPWEVFLGIGFDGEPIIIDMNELPHLFICGSTGSGKSKLVDHVLTSLIFGCNVLELELYLVQIAKEDLYIYEDMEQVRCFATNIEKTYLMLKHISSKMHERSKLIIPLKKKGIAGKITEYNKRNPANIMSTVYVVIDEFSSLMVKTSDSKEIKEWKGNIMDCLEEIAQIGRSVGVFLILSLQRPTADKLPPFVKAMCNVKISFRQTNKKSSEVALDDDTALNLEPRMAIIDTSERNFLKTLDITDKAIINYLKPHLKPHHRTLIFDKVNSDNKPKEKGTQKSKGRTPIEFNKVSPTKDAAISNIPNFVPYEEPKVENVIDKTKIPMQTEKPHKGKVKLC